MQPNEDLNTNNQSSTPPANDMVKPSMGTVDTAPAGTSPAPAPAVSPMAGMQPPAAPVSASTMAGAVNKSKRKKMFLVGGIVAGLTLLAAGSAAAYFAVVVPSQPQRIAGDAIANSFSSEKSKSGKFEGEVSFSGGEVSKVISSVGFEGSANASNAFELKLKINTLVTQLGVDLRSPGDKSLYVRMSGLEGLDKLMSAAMARNMDQATAAAMSQQLVPIVQAVNNNWYVIDESLLNQATQGELMIAQSQGVNAAGQKKISEAYKNNQFLTINKRLDDQDIKGQPSYHVEATIDNAKLKGFLEAIKSANLEGLKLTQEQIDQITKVDLSKSPIELWVSKKGRMITQLSTSLEQEGVTMKVRVALFDYNKDVTIEKPADAKSIMELMGELAPLMGGSGVMGTNSEQTLPLGLTL